MAEETVNGDARNSPADIYLVMMRGELLRVHRLDPSLDCRAALEASRMLLIDAGWTDAQITRNDANELEALDLYPPRTTQEIRADARERTLREARWEVPA